MPADVCLLLEGTWPYVAGGVSTWIQQILEAMPHLRFSILYLGADRAAPRAYKYPIPSNVVTIVEIFLQDLGKAPPGGIGRSSISGNDWAAIDDCQRCFAEGEIPDLAATCAVLDRFRDDDDFLANLAHSPQGWNLVVQQYMEMAPAGTPFLHYFWTNRFINITALNILRTHLPEARIYHSACTGYAGLLGAKARAINDRPFILTEHGIYQRERRIEIFNAAWIRDQNRREFLDLRDSQGVFKEWWTRFFQAQSRAAYASADAITTLFDANRLSQIEAGADPERLRIIPNGITIAPFLALPLSERQPGNPLRIGFVGRVTGIKDVKTFLQALGLLRDRGVAFAAYIIGPYDEEEGYAAECRELAVGLNLGGLLTFTGRVNVLEWYRRLDVVVLTSLSEGLPFVILEANAAGIPVVATEVGACRELLNGRTPEDRALGSSGLVTPVASPAATATALEELSRQPGLCRNMGLAGRERVRRFYDLRDVMTQYQELYESFLYAGQDAAGAD